MPQCFKFIPVLASDEFRGVAITSTHANTADLSSKPPRLARHPFVWTDDPDKIIAAVGRGHQALDAIQRVGDELMKIACFAAAIRIISSEKGEKFNIKQSVRSSCTFLEVSRKFITNYWRTTMTQGFWIATIIAAATILASSHAEAASIKLGAPVTPESIKAGKRYTASLTVSSKDDVKIKSVGWLWSGEGPFKYSHKFKNGKITARLITRHPGTYTLKARVCFKKPRKECLTSAGKKISVSH